jgi:CheY-like chemotaxis protein
MDFHMPRLDVLEATRRIAGDHDLGVRRVLILISSGSRS